MTTERVGADAGAARRKKWRLFAALAWASLAVAAVWSVLARGLSSAGSLDEQASTARLTLEWAGLMTQTFSFHAALAMAPTLLFALATRRRVMLALAILLTAALAAPEAAAASRRTGPPRAETGASEQPTLTILSANVLVWERDERPLLALIEQFHPDVVLFQEWTDQWERRAGAALDASFPHRVHAIGQGAFGHRVASKLPFVQPPVLFPRFGNADPWDDPQVRFGVPLGHRVVELQCVHLRPPTYQSRFEGFVEQREQVLELAGWCEDKSGPLLVIGDFNFTPRTFYGREMRRAGMVEAHDVAGVRRGTTWPRVGTLRFLPGIRIDQCYAKGVQVVQSSVLTDIGSDHAPVLFRVR